jgi:hypothetical protein
LHCLDGGAFLVVEAVANDAGHPLVRGQAQGEVESHLAVVFRGHAAQALPYFV